VIVNTLLDPVRYMMFDVDARIGHHPAENVDDLYWVSVKDSFGLSYASVDVRRSAEDNGLALTKLPHPHAT